MAGNFIRLVSLEFPKIEKQTQYYQLSRTENKMYPIDVARTTDNYSLLNDFDNLSSAGLLEVGNKVLAILWLLDSSENHLCSL